MINAVEGNNQDIEAVVLPKKGVRRVKPKLPKRKTKKATRKTTKRR